MHSHIASSQALGKCQIMEERLPSTLLLVTSMKKNKGLFVTYTAANIWKLNVLFPIILDVILESLTDNWHATKTSKS